MPDDAPPPAELRPSHVYVVSTALGFAGAFASAEEARRLLIDAYPALPFICQQFPLTADQPVDRVWVVPYLGCEAPAIVTNDRERARRTQEMLLRVGWTYEGDIDNWAQPMGHVRDSVRAHADAQASAIRMYADGDQLAEERRLEAAARDQANLEQLTRGPSEDGPLARAIRENELLEIFSCVEPMLVQNASDASTST